MLSTILPSYTVTWLRPPAHLSIINQDSPVLVAMNPCPNMTKLPYRIAIKSKKPTVTRFLVALIILRADMVTIYRGGKCHLLHATAVGWNTSMTWCWTKKSQQWAHYVQSSENALIELKKYFKSPKPVRCVINWCQLFYNKIQSALGLKCIYANSWLQA